VPIARFLSARGRRPWVLFAVATALGFGCTAPPVAPPAGSGAARPPVPASTAPAPTAPAAPKAPAVAVAPPSTPVLPLPPPPPPPGYPAPPAGAATPAGARPPQVAAAPGSLPPSNTGSASGTTLYACLRGSGAQTQLSPIAMEANVDTLCRRHPEMGPCQYERQICRQSGGRVVYSATGEEITLAHEAEYDKRVMRKRFQAN
jgi:hypothetical protein